MKMRLKFMWIFVCGFLANPSHGIGVEEEQSSSVFTNILKSLSSSSTSPTCPGRCFNALAALACRDVIDKPGLCPDAGYRCCKNLSSQDEEPSLSTTPSEEKITSQTPTKNKFETESSVSDVGFPAIEFGLNGAGDEPIYDETNEKTQDELLQYSAPSSVKVCPGVCVAKRISNFCEAAIDVQGLCKPELRCCVPANLFDGVDSIPKEFIVLNPIKENKSEEQQPHESLNDAESYITTPSTTTTKPIQTSSLTTRTKTTTVTTEGTTTKHMNDHLIESMEDSGKAPTDDEFEGIPPEKRCKGTCIAGVFSFLCDAIDRSGECPRNGRCCVTRKPSKSKPRPNMENEDAKDRPNPNRRTSPRPKPRPKSTTTTTTTTSVATTIRTTTPRTTTTLPTTVSTDPPPPPCPGKCLPVSVASRCKSPSHLIVASGCRDDEICCDDRNRKRPQEEKEPMPLSNVPQALGTLLSLFGGSPQKSPSSNRRTMPPRPSTTTTTTTPSTTTTTEAIIIPECPGTCISPILSFTCFGNAEISDQFRCSKDKQSCCAPKSAIRELHRVNEHNYNTARNDTVFTPPFHPHGAFIQQQQYSTPYEYGAIPPYHGSQEGTNYRYPSYRPVPPPQQQYPPSHILNQPHQQHQLNQQHQPHQPHEDQDQSLLYSNIPQEHAQAGQQHTYAYPPEDQTYYQNHVTYAQNETSGYPYPPVDSTTLPSTINSPPDQVGVSPVENKYVCGVKGTNRVARVVGGEDAVPGEWCWQVALINSLNQYLCGGALIGTQWVLTAAHCVTNIVRSGDAIYVRVGDHDLTTRYGSPGAQTIPVATTYIHHNHNSQTLDNDIALLKLSSHAELGEGVCLVCLPARGVSQGAGKRCVVTGYGYMGETGPIPLRVREAEIPVVSDNECVRKINAVTEKIFILPASSFCAGGESGHDACQGDGGGPLVCNVDNYYELSGLVSWGFGCGRQDVPGVYVKVSSFIGWVNQIIRVNN